MLLDRFLKYVQIDTMSMEDQNKTPSTDKQFDLANELKRELEELGLLEVNIDSNAIVTAFLPANTKKRDDTIGFIAHMDTIPGFSGTNVKPNVITSYDGKDINLKNNVSLTVEKFPFLSNLKGKTLITTDGTTVLGADDKAGVAEIMSMLEFFVKNPDERHTNIKVAFTPDEEIGGGIESFDILKFACDYAYTVDGEKYNEVSYENFNAASAVVTIKGVDVHPGDAKGKMINAAMIACEFESKLPEFEKPMYTTGYEGFNHLCMVKGECGSATLDYILRNHSKEKLERQKNDFIALAKELNEKYGDGVVTVNIKDSYKNMAEFIKKDPRSLNRAIEAYERLGIKAETNPIRGGTDGANLTLRGLNTPNLGTGGYNCHGPYEFACLEEMQKVTEVLIEIAKIR